MSDWRETLTYKWEDEVATQVRHVLDGTPQEWLDPRDFGAVYHYSPEQAGHILRRACEYGTLERTKEGRRFVYRPTPRVSDAVPAMLPSGHTASLDG